jgi:general secretion pathway protein K
MRTAAQPMRAGARQRGAALLLAMIILTLVSTLAAGMVWQQWRATEVEAAERARLQSAWILSGALDWARLILREDARSRGAPDHLGEPWAVPLAEARLSTFLAADKNVTASDDGIEAFLSGSIEDAQARLNLRHIGSFPPDTVDSLKFMRALRSLCDRAGLPSDFAGRLAQALRDAWATKASEAAPIAPNKIDDLAWLGVEPEAIERLRPWVIVLPAPTLVNLNTAPPEVLAAVIDGADLGTAQRLVEARRRAPFKSLDDAANLMPGAGQTIDRELADIKSSYFIVRGRLRLGDRVLEEQSLVRRMDRRVTALQRERVNTHLSSR